MYYYYAFPENDHGFQPRLTTPPSNESQPYLEVKADLRDGEFVYESVTLDVLHSAGMKDHASDQLFHLRTTGKNRTHSESDLPVFTKVMTRNRHQSIHVMKTYETEKVSLLETKERSLDVPLMELEVVLEQKLNEYFQTAAIHL